MIFFSNVQTLQIQIYFCLIWRRKGKNKILNFPKQFQKYCDKRCSTNKHLFKRRGREFRGGSDEKNKENASRTRNCCGRFLLIDYLVARRVPIDYLVARRVPIDYLVARRVAINYLVARRVPRNLKPGPKLQSNINHCSKTKCQKNKKYEVKQEFHNICFCNYLVFLPVCFVCLRFKFKFLNFDLIPKC